MSEVNKGSFFKYGKQYMSSGLILPIRRFVTLELLLYLVGHITCLYVLLFYASDMPFSKLGGGFLRDYFRSLQGARVGSAFDVFRSCLWLASAHSHKVSSDLVLTFLLLFTSNAFFLTLMRRIEVVVAEEKIKPTNVGMNSVEEGAYGRPTNGRKDSSSYGLVNCDELLRNTMIFKSLILCIVVPICVFSQPANEVRAFGPVGVLLLIVVGVCVLELHGGLQTLKKFLNWTQLIIILLIIFFSAEANMLT